MGWVTTSTYLRLWRDPPYAENQDVDFLAFLARASNLSRLTQDGSNFIPYRGAMAVYLESVRL